MASNFPTSKQDLDATRGTSGQAMNAPNHITHHALEDDTVEAIQTKLGIDSSVDTASIDYLLKNTSSANPGHTHTINNGGTDITASSTELNYSVGVTSAIQTQLNAKGVGDLVSTNNLSDVTTAATALSNIGGIGAATTDTLTNKTIDANGTGNSISNIDVADLANGTDGELISWDSAGSPAVVATGTATQVLTSNGAGAAPTFQTPAEGTPEGTAVLSTGETVGKVLQADGDDTCSWVTLAGGGDALTANPLSQFAATTSAQLAGVISDETGTDKVVFNTSPTLVTPLLGTPTSGVLTNCTGTAAGLTAGAVSTITGLAPDTATTQATQAAITTCVNLETVGTIGAGTWQGTAVGDTYISSATAWNAKMDDLVDDTTPTLGGELDAGAHSIGFTMQTATGDGTTTIDWKLGNHMDFTFGAFNETFTFTAPTKPGVYTMSLKQDSVGSRTATWPASVKWPAGTAPTLTTAANTGYDIISFRYDGTNYYGVSTLNFS